MKPININTNFKSGDLVALTLRGQNWLIGRYNYVEYNLTKNPIMLLPSPRGRVLTGGLVAIDLPILFGEKTLTLKFIARFDWETTDINTDDLLQPILKKLS